MKLKDDFDKPNKDKITPEYREAHNEIKRISHRLKKLDGREKGILRKAFENDLPKEIAWRKKSPYPKTHNPAYFARVKELLAIALTDKSTPLMDWIDIDNLYLLLQNPDSLPEPWYGQLMGIPQIAAYIYQIYAWIKHYNVEFEI